MSESVAYGVVCGQEKPVMCASLGEALGRFRRAVEDALVTNRSVYLELLISEPGGPPSVRVAAEVRRA